MQNAMSALPHTEMSALGELNLRAPSTNLGLLQQTKLIVKIGSSSLVDEQWGLRKHLIESIAEQVAQVVKAGAEVIIISSGAVALGRILRSVEEAGSSNNPSKEQLAAYGQSEIFATWKHSFENHALNIKTETLTSHNLNFFLSELNAEQDSRVKIINGSDYANDSDSLPTGNNDYLTQVVAYSWNASHVVFLGSTAGILDEGSTVSCINSEHSLDRFTFFENSAFGTGGAKAKVLAAKEIAKTGAATVITSCEEEDVILRVLYGCSLGTLVR